MSNKIYTVAIIGAGSRGADAYGSLINQQKDKFKIVSLCDLRPERLTRFGELFGVDDSLLFTDENEFFKEKRADLLVIATQDKDHYRHMMKAFELGYDVLAEKPITDNEQECIDLLNAQKKYGVKALICHVLRYSPLFTKLKEVVESGIIGRLVAIDAIESPGYWHQAHSYVRGNWRDTKKSTPMILAKCCHDLDLLQYYAGSKCKCVSSIGDLTFFNKENAPDYATKRCLDCPQVDACPYSAKRVYVERWHDVGEPKDTWPFNVVTSAPVTEEKLLDAIKENEYGRCAFYCDNDAVDNQIVMMQFENGVKAQLTMNAFAGGRRYHLFGTLGNVLLDGANITVTVFGNKEKSCTIKATDLIEKGHAHGGGDGKLLATLYDMLSGNAPESTSLSASIESHLMGIRAEESRLLGGQMLNVHK